MVVASVLAGIICLSIFIARGVVSVENSSEQLHSIDKINISATVTDFSETGQAENVSKVFYESSDVINANLADTLIKNMISCPEEFIAMNYLSTFLVENLADAREYKVTEAHSNDDKISRLSVKDPLRNASSDCTFHSNGMGLATTGVRCKSSRNLPEECFCWDGICSHPFMPFHSVVNKCLTWARIWFIPWNVLSSNITQSTKNLSRNTKPVFCPDRDS